MKSDKVRLLHIANAIQLIEEFITNINEDNFSSNMLVQSAVERQLEIIGEAATHLSEETKEKYPNQPWFKIRAFRNVIAHEYFGISKKQIWNLIINEIPLLKTTISQMLNDTSIN